MGLISRYGGYYKNIPYLIKLNSKTNTSTKSNRDPYSKQLYTVDQVIQFKKNSNLNILGVGYTIYLGSDYESYMLSEASNIIFEAHQNGLIAILWMYPRGKNVSNEKDIHLISGAAGVATSLGADFVKVNFPIINNKHKDILYKEISLASGNTGVLFSGGSSLDTIKLLTNIHDQIHIYKSSGCAIGRNIHQKCLNDAIKVCNAISSIIYEKKDLKLILKDFM